MPFAAEARGRQRWQPPVPPAEAGGSAALAHPRRPPPGTSARRRPPDVPLRDHPATGEAEARRVRAGRHAGRERCECYLKKKN